MQPLFQRIPWSFYIDIFESILLLIWGCISFVLLDSHGYIYKYMSFFNHCVWFMHEWCGITPCSHYSECLKMEFCLCSSETEQAAHQAAQSLRGVGAHHVKVRHKNGHVQNGWVISFYILWTAKSLVSCIYIKGIGGIWNTCLIVGAYFRFFEHFCLFLLVCCPRE
jgi:hypothetical protein